MIPTNPEGVVMRKRRKVPTKYRKTLAVHYLDDNGEKILCVAKIGKYGTEWKRKFSIKHLLDEQGNVTEQTLEEEKRLFRKPTRL